MLLGKYGEFHLGKLMLSGDRILELSKLDGEIYYVLSCLAYELHELLLRKELGYDC